MSQFIFVSLLNNSHRMAKTSHISDQAHHARKCSKIPILSEEFVQSVRSGVEGGKTATISGLSQGTSVAALQPDSGQTFFNIPFFVVEKVPGSGSAIWG